MKSSRLREKNFFVLFENNLKYLKSLQMLKDHNQSEDELIYFLIIVSNLWELQRKKVFKNDQNFFLTKFTIISKLKLNYSSFIENFITKIFGDKGENKKTFLMDNLGNSWKSAFSGLNFKNEVYYSDDISLFFENYSKSFRSIKNKLPNNIPIFNLFLIFEKFDGKINNYIIGSIFERYLIKRTKKATAAYYTPEYICDFISSEVLKPFILKILKNMEMKNKISIENNLQNFFSSMDIYNQNEVLLKLLEKIISIRILDPALGSGIFLKSIIKNLIDIYRFIWKKAKELQIKDIFTYKFKLRNKKNEIIIKTIDLLNLKSFKEVSLYLKILEIFPNQIFGTDINPNAVIMTKLNFIMSLYKNCNYMEKFQLFNKTLFKNIKTGNSLTGFKNWKEFQQRFDVIIGNPPYGNILTETEKKILENNYSYINEISAVFLERGIELNKKGGNLAFITSYTITFNKNLTNTRKKIFNNYQMCKIATFDRDKCRLFKEMTQSLSIIQCVSKNDILFENNSQNRKTSGIFTTKMYRNMPNLSKLNYQRADNLLLGKFLGSSYLTKHRLPKIGDPKQFEIISYLNLNISKVNDSNLKTIGDLIGSVTIIKSLKQKIKKLKNLKIKTDQIIWIRISGNYWYNAWDRAPYFGSQIAFVKLSKNIKYLREFLLILINSSFFYFWFRIFSDGRHLNTDILRALPIPKNLKKFLNKNGKIIREISSNLMKALFENFNSTRNRFHTSKIKAEIDACDIVLGKLFQFSDETVDYIQNYDKTIRGGKQIKKQIENSIKKLLN